MVHVDGWRQAPTFGTLFPEYCFVPYEEDVEVVAARGDGTSDRRHWRPVTAHRIHCDSDRHGCLQSPKGQDGGLDLFYVEDLAPSVGPALHADPVPLFPSAAGLTAYECGVELDGIVSPPHVATPLARLSLRDGHGSDSP